MWFLCMLAFCHLGKSLFLCLLHLFWREVALAGCKRPYMSIRVNQLPGPVTPECVHYWHRNGCTCGRCLGEYLFDVFDIDVYSVLAPPTDWGDLQFISGNSSFSMIRESPICISACSIMLPPGMYCTIEIFGAKSLFIKLDRLFCFFDYENWSN